MSSKSNYTAEEKQKLIENFKTETWNNLVSYERESLVKRTAKKLGLSRTISPIQLKSQKFPAVSAMNR